MGDTELVKTWGPFTGRQLTTMIVAVVVAVAVPVGAFAAVSGSNVFVADATSGARAQVDSTGHLRVTDGSGPMTVDGNVAAVPRPSRPWNTINGTPIGEGNETGLVYAGLGGQGKLNITSFYAANFSGAPVQVNMYTYVASTSDASCYNLNGGGFAVGERFAIEVPANNTTTLTYPTPLTLSAYALAGKPFCVVVFGTGASGWSANIGASGFIA